MSFWMGLAVWDRTLWSPALALFDTRGGHGHDFEPDGDAALLDASARWPLKTSLYASGPGWDTPHCLGGGPNENVC